VVVLQAQYDFKEEDLRPYFPLPKVLDGLFSLAHKLFGVTIEAADGDAPVWHPDVRFFKVSDATTGETWYPVPLSLTSLSSFSLSLLSLSGRSATPPPASTSPTSTWTRTPARRRSVAARGWTSAWGGAK
jgi:hypothetical protein